MNPFEELEKFARDNNLGVIADESSDEFVNFVRFGADFSVLYHTYYIGFTQYTNRLFFDIVLESHTKSVLTLDEVKTELEKFANLAPDEVDAYM